MLEIEIYHFSCLRRWSQLNASEEDLRRKQNVVLYVLQYNHNLTNRYYCHNLVLCDMLILMLLCRCIIIRRFDQSCSETSDKRHSAKRTKLTKDQLKVL